MTEATPQDIAALANQLEHQNPDDATVDESNFANAEQPEVQDGLDAQIAARGSSSENISPEPSE